MDLSNGVYFNFVPLVIFFPLAGLLINLLVGKKLGEVGIGMVASLASGLAFFVAVLLGISLFRQPGAVTVSLADWIVVGGLSLSWAFRVDTLSVLMMLVVGGVGTLIHVYATGYMHEDVRHNGEPARYNRFFIYFNLFILSMMILVSAANYLVLFVGWEGVGLCSYLLIGFWFEKGKDGTANASAGKKAFVVNRIGDFGVLIALFMLFSWFGSLDFNTIFSKAPQVAQAAPGVILAITLFLLMGVAGKSAQLPLFVWLPDAMAGPTPVSALIHAATMVTAGVYLVARSAPLYTLVPTAQSVVTWVGAVTALFAATIAAGQYDIKKVLAYSTISQLGFMVAAVGMGAFVGGMFHLVTHAFFKALLFLSAGSVIIGMERGEHRLAHAHGAPDKGGAKPMSSRVTSIHSPAAPAQEVETFDVQDMRNMGGLRERMPVTFWVYLIGALALAGIVPLAGFFSKDEILAEASRYNPAIFWLLVLAAFLTAFYMGRQVLMVFLGRPRSAQAERAEESRPVMTVPLILLAILATVGGVINLPFGSGGVDNLLTRWLQATFPSVQMAEFNLVTALTALGISLLGLFIAWYIYGKSQPLGREGIDPLKRLLGPVFTGMEHKWWVDEAYAAVIVRPFQGLANFLSQPVDLGVIDGISRVLASGVVWTSAGLRRLQNGFVRYYAFIVLVGVIVILSYLMSILILR